MDDRKMERARNHPAVRSLSGQDQTGELSWPLVERRQDRAAPPSGVERRRLVTDQRRPPFAAFGRFFRPRFGSTQPPSEQLEQLTSANQLLLSLQKIAINLPSSFDLDTVLDQAVTQIQSLLGADVVTILLADRTAQKMTIHRGRGSANQTTLLLSSLPDLANGALEVNYSLRSRPSDDYQGFAEEAVQGACCALRSRGNVVGIVSAEWRSLSDIDRETQVLTGLSDALAMAIDNAFLFKDLRRTGANEERRRIARDLHDRTGSTLALLGFEIDRLMRNEADSETGRELNILRSHVDSILGEVREMLFDIRFGSDGQSSLEILINEFAPRVEARSGLTFELQLGEFPQFDASMTSEIWEIVKESITNAERHSNAAKICVRTMLDKEFFVISVEDDGAGIEYPSRRADSYGLIGMIERSESIHAEFSIESPLGSQAGGTRISLKIPTPNNGSAEGPET